MRLMPGVIVVLALQAGVVGAQGIDQGGRLTAVPEERQATAPSTRARAGEAAAPRADQGGGGRYREHDLIRVLLSGGSLAILALAGWLVIRPGKTFRD